MKRTATLFAFIFLSIIVFGQKPHPVSWSFELDSASNGTKVIKATAIINSGWHIYANDIESGGPIPTDLIIDSMPGITIDKKLEQTGNVHGPEHDEYFGIDVKWFTGEATFSRNFTVHGDVKIVKGYITYMSCDDHQCLPPEDVPFKFNLSDK